MAADDDQLRLFRMLDELTSRVTADDKAMDVHVGVVFLPPRQALSQNFVLRRLHRRPIHAGKVERSRIAPCMQGDEIHVPARRLVERDRRGQFRSRRAVDTDEDRRLRRMRHQRIFVVDDRDRAVRVLDQAGTHRTEQSCRVRRGRGYPPRSSRPPSTSRREWERWPSSTSRSSTCRAVSRRGLIDDPIASSRHSSALLLLPFSDAGGSGVWDKGPTTLLTTWTRMSVVPRIAASRAAQSTATFEAGDPSTPTTISGALIEWTYCDVMAIRVLQHEALVPNRSANGPYARRTLKRQDQSTRGIVPSPLRRRCRGVV